MEHAQEAALVLAPEMQIAFYGGDPDNFTYPRWDLDVTFFRVYEDGKPLKTDHYLKWNAGGAKDGELVFVSGHPGSTNRLHTMAQLEYARDVTYPLRLDVSRRRLEVLKTYADRGPEEARRASNGIFGIENGIKVTGGEYKGLKDPDLIAKKAQQEHEMRAMVDLREDWKELYGWAWDTVIAVIPRLKARAKEDTYRALSSTLFSHARTIVQYHEEVKKPNGERLSPYQDANIAVTKFRLLSKAPVYADLEEAQLAGSIALALEKLGPQDPYVLAVLGVEGKAPDAAAPPTPPLQRSTTDEKNSQIKRLRAFQGREPAKSKEVRQRLRDAVVRDQNVFAVLMDAVRYCSLREITDTLFEVGGKYRRNM